MGDGRRAGEGNGSDEVSADPIDGERQAVHDQIHAGKHNGHDPVGGQVVGGELVIGCLEFLLLVVLGIVGPDHPQTSEIFPGDPVQVIRERLDSLKPGHGEGDGNENQHQHEQHGAEGGGSPLPALGLDFTNGPHGHNGRFDDDLKPHGDQHLNLGYVVGGPGDQAGGGKPVDFLHGKVFHLAENTGAEPHGKGSGNPGGQITGHDGKRQASQGAQQHLTAGQPDVGHSAALRLDQGGDFRHVVRHGEIQPDLAYYQKSAQDNHHDFLLLKSFE